MPNPLHTESELSPNRVVVTGIGIITALGPDYSSNAEGFRTGRTAFRPVTLFDVERQRAKVAAEVDLTGELPETRLSARAIQRLNRAARILLHAAGQALDQAGWGMDTAPVAVVLGTTSGGMTEGEAYYRQATQHPGRGRGQPTRVWQYLIPNQAGLVGTAFGFHGTATVISNACASGANAIGHAWHLLRSGRAQRALAGGYDILSQLVYAGFDSLQALSTTVCRPFDVHRDGLALGEGAGILALETLEHARGRGAEILGELAGYSAASDTHHLTQPHPEGDAALRTMIGACRIAGVVPAQIGYVNAHGTGTPLNDAAESHAIHRWAGEEVSKIQVSSTKASIGHLLGAAGAVEAIVCLMTLRENWLPPTASLDSPDPVCRFPLVREPQSAAPDYVLSNSFGFGGANATLLFKRAS